MALANDSSSVRMILAGASGTVKVMLRGGGTITGTVDVSKLARGVVLITDATPMTWVIPVDNVEAAGQ